MPRPVDLAAQDLLVDAEGVVVEEGRVAGQHLVEEDAEGPPVHRLVVTFRLDDLRRLQKYYSQGFQNPTDADTEFDDDSGWDYTVALMTFSAQSINSKYCGKAKDEEEICINTKVSKQV